MNLDAMMGSPQHHPSSETLDAFARGRLSDTERQGVAEHLSQCAACRSFADAEPTILANADLYGTTPPEQFPGPPIDGLPDDLANHPRYEILRQLGHGGMGSVYEARHVLMQRTVALKVVRGALIANAAAIARFRQEVRTAASLSHPNIVSAFDAEQSGNTHFLVMEYVPGTSLGAYLRNKGRLAVAEACSYASQIAEGLQHAFEQGMIHRDIKPDNLMRMQEGKIKILDFGLARLGMVPVDPEVADSASSQESLHLTSAGAVVGTPDYMAPEQGTDSRAADIRADIYSLGCTLYQMLAGCVPFPGGSSLDKIARHAGETPTPLQQLRPELPRALVAIVEKMLAKSPAERFQTPAEVAAVLHPFWNPGRPVRRRLIVAAMLLVLVLLGIVWSVNEGRRNRTEALPRDDQERALPSAVPFDPLKRHLLVIGCDDYRAHDLAQGLLRFAASDAKEVHAVMTDPQIGGIPAQNSRLLVDEDATAANIRAELAKLEQLPTGTTTILFYSGHALSKTGIRYLVAHDTSLSNLAATGIAIDRLALELPSDELLVMVDANFGEAGDQEPAMGEPGHAARDTVFAEKTWALLGGASFGNMAYERPELGHGVFTHSLLRGLRGDADSDSDRIITVLELALFLDPAIHRADPTNARRQRPLVELHGDPSKFSLIVAPERRR